MMKCKFCLAEIEDGALRCPCCGKDLEETVEETAAPEAAAEVPAEEVKAEETPVEETPAEEAPKKATPGKIAVAVALIVVLVSVLAALILVGMQNLTGTEESVVTEPAEETIAATAPADGEPGTPQEKGSYTVSDEEAIANKDVVVATVGDAELTNGQLQVYYWMGYHNFMSANYSYAQYFGLDLSQPLDVQIMNPALHGEDVTMTWQQYFLQFGLDSWHQVQSVALAAEEAGLEMAPEDADKLENLEKTIEEAIAQYNVSVEDYLAMNFGHSAGVAEYRNYQQTYYRGAPYYAEETAKALPSDAELEAYFADHEEEYASGNITKDTILVDVRHILIQPENAKEDGTFSDEDWAECEKKAQALLDEYLAGEKTEDAFAAMAVEHSTDPGSSANGGLYEGVYMGQMVAPFEEWCFDAARKHGDTGLVKTDYGYHIMYFVEAQEDVWKDYVKNDWIQEKSDALLEAVIAEHPMEVSYDKIVIGNLMEQN